MEEIRINGLQNTTEENRAKLLKFVEDVSHNS